MEISIMPVFFLCGTSKVLQTISNRAVMTPMMIFHCSHAAGVRLTPKTQRDIAVVFFNQTQMYIFFGRKSIFSNCFKCAENLYGPLSLCSESIARVGKNQKPVFPGLKPGFMFENPGSELRWQIEGLVSQDRQGFRSCRPAQSTRSITKRVHTNFQRIWSTLKIDFSPKKMYKIGRFGLAKKNHCYIW